SAGTIHRRVAQRRFVSRGTRTHLGVLLAGSARPLGDARGGRSSRAAPAVARRGSDGAGTPPRRPPRRSRVTPGRCPASDAGAARGGGRSDRKSTRLNSSHVKISYAVFCLKKKNKNLH